ncbi:site-specific integrase [Spirosoma foliorum]|uniref:Phage integrase SAM-like domain-containing protein n=1 Tax=Spirosoma foliorum TaxID=2710596 RepID=A0A7G5H6J8_9BACT|nr:site-specific integrase [Spirosoma foliorum]QMW06740.1 phage integrase SAM-like domain-containing protein [Spirosoma foliorum]
MASSLKVVLRKKANQTGVFPLAIRVTIDRKSSYIYLGQQIREADWDAAQQKVRKSHPNSVRLNNEILQKRAEANDKLLEMGTQHKAVSSKAVRKQLKSSQSASFFALAETFIENMRKQGKYNRVSTEQPRINHFRDFLKDKDITFPEITVSLLNKFKSYLKGSRQVGERTIANHLVLVRTIFNQAIAEGLVDQKYYPFGKGKVGIKIPESVKIGLNAEDVAKLENADLSSCRPYWTHARNMWLISFWFAGMRASDVLRLKHSDFQNGRLHYTMGKNAKSGSLKVPEKALKIIEQYPKNTKHDLVFPELQPIDDISNGYEVQRKIAFAIKRLDKNLQDIARFVKIDKSLTMHIARHTFGNLSGDKISIQQLQKLYRHTSITTTIGYQGHFIHKDADEALEAVIGL